MSRKLLPLASCFPTCYKTLFYVNGEDLCSTRSVENYALHLPMKCGVRQGHNSALSTALSPCRYTVNELGRWEMEFGIHVKTYDQVTTKEGNITKPKWVPGGEIVIGPHVRKGRGKYGRVSTLRDIVGR